MECLYTPDPGCVGDLAFSAFSKGAEITSIPSGDTAHSSFKASTSFGMRYLRLNCRVTNPDPSYSQIAFTPQVNKGKDLFAQTQMANFTLSVKMNSQPS